MSAFLVGKETIDRIVTGLDYECRNDGYLAEQMKEMTGIEYLSDDWKTRIGRKMLMTNLLALHERYNDEITLPTWYNFYPRPATRIQYLKSLQCFTYQCAEGKVPELPIYKFFDQVLERKFMVSIIYNMKEYDQADWA